jgi:hypothetical protein
MVQNNSAGTHQPGTPKGEQVRMTQGGSGRYKTGSTTAAGSMGKSTVRDASGVVTSKAPISPQSPYLPPA